MNGPARLVCILVGGVVFGAGLAVAGMHKPEVVLSFLHFDDLGLLLVLGAGATVTMITYQLAPRLLRRPLLAETFRRRDVSVGWTTYAGAAVFGLGWGLAGTCPGGALASLGAGDWPILIALGAMFAGALARGLLHPRLIPDPPGPVAAPGGAA